MAELKLIWTPEQQEFPAGDEDALILSQENETNVTATLTAKQKDQGVMPYTLTWTAPDGLPVHCKVYTTSGNVPELKIDVADWMGVFKIAIDYMLDGAGVGIGQTSHATDDWDAVPATTADVYSYQASTINVTRNRLEVTAFTKAGDEIETVIYTITVYANYDIGRDALKSAVQQRKDAV